MEKKRVFSKSLLLLAITSIMLFAMSITSMAATETDMNIQQTGSSSSKVDILPGKHTSVRIFIIMWT